MFPLELPGWELGWLGRATSTLASRCGRQCHAPPADTPHTDSRTTSTLASSCGRQCYAPPIDNPPTQIAGPPGGTLGP